MNLKKNNKIFLRNQKIRKNGQDRLKALKRCPKKIPKNDVYDSTHPNLQLKSIYYISSPLLTSKLLISVNFPSLTHIISQNRTLYIKFILLHIKLYMQLILRSAILPINILMTSSSTATKFSSKTPKTNLKWYQYRIYKLALLIGSTISTKMTICSSI